MNRKPEVQVATAGFCRSLARFASVADSWRVVEFPARFGILTMGRTTILFDTGYAPRVQRALSGFPFGLYGALLPVTVNENETAAAQLRAMGRRPEDVETIVVSHFHPDHIGGLLDFPNATFICSRAAWDDVKSARGVRALRRGFLADLVPPDFEARAKFVEDFPKSRELPGLGPAASLELNGVSLGFPRLDGHVVGQIGLYLPETESEPCLFVADACWNADAVKLGAMPNPIGMAVQDDRASYRDTIAKIRAFARQAPGTRIIVTHARETADA